MKVNLLASSALTDVWLSLDPEVKTKEFLGYNYDRFRSIDSSNLSKTLNHSPVLIRADKRVSVRFFVALHLFFVEGQIRSSAKT